MLQICENLVAYPCKETLTINSDRYIYFSFVIEAPDPCTFDRW